MEDVKEHFFWDPGHHSYGQDHSISSDIELDDLQAMDSHQQVTIEEARALLHHNEGDNFQQGHAPKRYCGHLRQRRDWRYRLFMSYHEICNH